MKGFQLGASSINVELNLAFGDGVSTSSPVVDFIATFNDPGYPVATGSGEAYLNFTRRRIHASASNVLINLSGFVYLKAGISVDLGSRESVTINTGIPGSIGSLVEFLRQDINSVILTLGPALVTLKDELMTAVNNALGAVIASIGTSIDSLVDSLFEKKIGRAHV